GIDAALHRPVTAPQEEEIGTLVDGFPGLGRRLSTLGHLIPDRLPEPPVREDSPQLTEASAQGLHLVGDDSHGRHRATATGTSPGSTRTAGWFRGRLS